MKKLMSKSFLLIAAIFSVCFGVGGYIWHEVNRPHLLEVYVLDVKSSPVIFIRTANDQRILINGGANSEIIRNLTKILPFYSHRIDLIIATKADAKDATGLVPVIDRYKIGKVLVPGVDLVSLGLATSTDSAYQAMLNETALKKIPIEKISAGQSRLIDSVSFDFLFPIASTSFKYSKASAPELIIQMSYGSTSIMFLGNVSPKIQKSIASTSKQSDVLIVSNSANPNNLAPILMNKIGPQYLIYSKTLSTKKTAANSKNKKTDPLYFVTSDRRYNLKEKGTVKIVSDGSFVKIE